MTDILPASIIFAVLFAAAFMLAGLNWRTAWLFAVIGAAGVGISAAHYLDRF
jgi:cell division protein FtsW (lipid II flippase)